MNIKQLFDPSKDIYRSIEKVIAYGVSQEERLKKEVSEYVVTDSIDEQFNKLLLKMQAAMDAGDIDLLELLDVARRAGQQS